MPLISCPECGRQISTQAESCPQCGHPNRGPSASSDPTRYACAALATTKCARCGAFSCARHLTNLEVYHAAEHSISSSHELICKTCKLAAEKQGAQAVRIGCAIVVIAIVGGIIFLIVRGCSGG